MLHPRMPHASLAPLLLLVLAGCAARAAAPAPSPAIVPGAFDRAVARGTRTATGRPGPGYWQQWTQYRLAGELDSATARVTGRGNIRYHNRSPDTLDSVAVHLHQNLFAPNAPKNEDVPVTGGIELTSVAAQGQPLAARASDDPGVGYTVRGTIGWLRLPRALAPGDSLDLEIAWRFTMPGLGAPRMGSDGQVWFVAYWYPQMAVYDDIGGWHVDPYLGNAEFYMGYGEYDVELTVPADWIVTATGALQNADQVLAAPVRERLAEARRSPRPVRIVGPDELRAGGLTTAGSDGKHTWRFRADSVRDFSWSTSRRWLWDATIAEVGDADGDGAPDTAAVHAYYRSGVKAWEQGARYGRHSVEFLSRYLFPYPYPHMTAVEGIIGGGMEFPMMTLIGTFYDTTGLYTVTVHEIAHMWFPMLIGSDEKRFAWQDEGLASFLEAQGARDIFGRDVEPEAVRNYLMLARAGAEVELMRHGDQYPPGSPAYGTASYDKPVAILRALRGVLGDSVFHRAFREYAVRWRYKHPQPDDFFNTFEDVSGQDLSWFWEQWFFETTTLDQAIGGVRTSGDSVEIVLERRGDARMPVRLAITREGGAVERVVVPVSIWRDGRTRHTLRVAAGPAVTRVEIDPEELFPDTDRRNQRWTR